MAGRDEVITDDVAASASALSPLPDLPPEPTNKYADNAAAATLGQKFFFDKAFSGPVTGAGAAVAPAPLVAPSGTKCATNCVTCHDRAGVLDDGKATNHVAIGTGIHPHNSPAVVNSAFYQWTNWNGRFKSQWELPLPVMEAPVIMNGTRLQMARVIYEKYKAEYNAVFTDDPLDERLNQALAGPTGVTGVANGEKFLASGKPSGFPGCNAIPHVTMSNETPARACNNWDQGTITSAKSTENEAADKKVINRIAANYGKAIHAYQRKLVSRNTPFDKYVAAGFKGSDINEASKKGLALFVGKAACNKCHNTPFFTDSSFKNTGVKHVNDADVPKQAPQPATNMTMSDDARFVGAAQLIAPGSVNVASVYSDDVAAGTAALAEITPPVTTPPTPFADAFGSFKGAFRDPTLRGVRDTPPYMHSGEIKTLLDVVKFYNIGGDTGGFSGVKDPLIVPLNLTDDEMSQIVEFMNTLSDGDAIDPALVADTSVPTPAGAPYCQ